MRKKLSTIILVCLIVTSELVFGKDSSKTHKANKNPKHSKDKPQIERVKRSLDDDEDKPFWANRGKKQIDEHAGYNENTHRAEYNFGKVPKLLRERDTEDEPFWGTRGRRDSSSVENSDEDVYPENVPYDCIGIDCFGTLHRFSNREHKLKSSNDDSMKPFWGMRGRRDSSEMEDSSSPFWGNRGRRQDDDPFWGARGRRKDEPFWGTRGRREDSEVFWGNRGRRQEPEPFWGNRGRRQEPEQFWGSRGRRDYEPFWSKNGKQKEVAFWGARGRRKEDLKQSILNAMDRVENNIEYLSRLKKSESSFWSNRSRDSKLKLFGSSTSRLGKLQESPQYDLNFKNNDPGTLTDSRMYADEPNFIVVERSSRSSGEVDDPFYITRGKKYLNLKLFKAARDRRGALEEIVKSVRNDPYFIARGKKDDANTTSTDEELSKTKELICSAVEMVNVKENGKVKREIDTDRDRRTILKKLTAQLQNDPYFVSRGKKSDGANKEDNLREFITDIANKC